MNLKLCLILHEILQEVKNHLSQNGRWPLSLTSKTLLHIYYEFSSKLAKIPRLKIQMLFPSSKIFRFLCLVLHISTHSKIKETKTKQRLY